MKKNFVLISIVLFLGGCIYGKFTSDPPGAQVYDTNWLCKDSIVEGCITPCSSLRFQDYELSDQGYFVKWPDGTCSENKHWKWFIRSFCAWPLINPIIPVPSHLHFIKEGYKPPEKYEDPATKPKYIE